LSHEIPPAQMEAIKKCKYIWCSHGHPDHINLNSIVDLTGAQILLADHYNGRLKTDLTGMGFSVRVLPERTWESLSPNVRVLTISDANQDSILLVDVGGVLVINLNDAGYAVWERFVRDIAKTFKTVVLMRLWGEGAADMTNLFTEDGERIAKPEMYNLVPLGQTIQTDGKRFGATHVVPFSSFHRFQRTDSIWANDICTPFDQLGAGADPNGPQMLPAFVRFNAETGEISCVNPKLQSELLKTPEDCGDNWSDCLETADQAAIRAYFQSKEKLRDFVGYIRFIVGGKETIVDINPARKNSGVTFEAPRTSLMASVNYRVFDDIMIANFMKTTLHGDTPMLNGTFTRTVAKYGDNGLAESLEQLRVYHRHYFRRDPLGTILYNLESQSESMFRKFVPHNGMVHRAAKSLYWTIKG